MENAEYFKNRDVADTYYDSFKIPKHILYALPKNLDAKILDIGCGLGQFLLELKKNNYTNIAGVDVLDEAVDTCIKKGLTVSKIESISDYATSHDIKYDFVIMNHVLEHLPKEIVVSTLKDIRENLLSEKGILMVMVPNAQSVTGAYWMYEDFTHYTLYTTGSLLYVLRSAGFTHIDFVSPDGTAFMPWYKKIIIKALIGYLKLKEDFWNLVTQSSFHKPSPRIYTFELKVIAK